MSTWLGSCFLQKAVEKCELRSIITSDKTISIRTFPYVSIKMIFSGSAPTVFSPNVPWEALLNLHEKKWFGGVKTLAKLINSAAAVKHTCGKMDHTDSFQGLYSSFNMCTHHRPRFAELAPPVDSYGPLRPYWAAESEGATTHRERGTLRFLAVSAVPLPHHCRQ